VSTENSTSLPNHVAERNGAAPSPPLTNGDVTSKPSIRPESIYVLGDSHAMTYNLRLYTTGDERQVLFQSFYAGLSTPFCAAAEEQLSTAIRASLAHAGLLVKVGDRYEALHRTEDRLSMFFAQMEDRPRVDPAVVLSIGGLDIVHFGVGLAQIDDIALPPALAEAEGPLSAPTLPEAMPFDEAVELFSNQMQPLKQALCDLRQHGFERLALLSLAPPTPNDDAFRAARANLGLSETPSHATLSWRTKCAMVANTVLSSIARDTGVLFIDRWSDQVRNSVALPGLLDDWMHLSTWASDATALAIIERFDGVPSRPQAPPPNYQVYVEDPTVASGIREHTIDHADFMALKDAPGDAFVILNDVNELTRSWVNRARIARVVGI
jgi:hypothetical protein